MVPRDCRGWFSNRPDIGTFDNSITENVTSAATARNIVRDQRRAGFEAGCSFPLLREPFSQKRSAVCSCHYAVSIIGAGLLSLPPDCAVHIPLLPRPTGRDICETPHNTTSYTLVGIE
ncbi:hypothetical protein VTH82DRAFT_8290 [Thermothelomyces myriococcoides]